MPPKKKAYGHAQELPRGTKLPDSVTKSAFIISSVIGKGGFGTVYAAKVGCLFVHRAKT